MKKPIRSYILKAMIRKEANELKRDWKMKRVLFGAPIIMILLFGYAVNNDVKDISLSVLDNDKTSLSRSIAEKFTASGYFILHSNLESPKEIDTLIDSDKVEVFLNIENGLTKKIRSGRDATVQIILDGADTSRAAVISAYVNEIMNDIFFKQFSQKIKIEVLRKSSMNMTDDNAETQDGFKIKKGIVLNERIFFNPTLKSRNFFLPGVIAMIITVVTVMLTAMSIVKERETGTIEQIVVSPIKPVEFILGKTMLFAIIGLIDILVVSLITILWFEIPFNGSITFLLVTGFFHIMTVLSVGIFISSISKTQQQAMLSVFLFIIPAILLSGFIFPIYAMPEPAQIITYVNPLRYYMSILRGIFLKGTGIVEHWSDLVALIVFGVVLIIFSTRRLSRRLG